MGLEHTKDVSFFFLCCFPFFFFPFFVSCLVTDGSFWLVTLTVTMSVFQYKNSNLRLLLCQDNPEKKKSKSRVLLKAREGRKEGRSEGRGEKWVG